MATRYQPTGRTVRSIGRTYRHKGPATFAPVAPASGKHRRRMFKNACHEFLRLTHKPWAEIRAADGFQLKRWAEAIPEGDGRRGKARRAVLKIVRLRGFKGFAASIR